VFFVRSYVCGQMMEETGWTCSKHVSSDKFKTNLPDTLCHLQNLCVYGKVMLTDSITEGQFLDQLNDH